MSLKIVAKKSSGSTCKYTYECKDYLSPAVICNTGICCATDMFPLNDVCSKYTVHSNWSFSILNYFLYLKQY